MFMFDHELAYPTCTRFVKFFYLQGASAITGPE